MIWSVFGLFIDFIEAIIFIRFGNSIYNKKYNSKIIYYFAIILITSIIFVFDEILGRYGNWYLDIVIIVLIFIVIYYLYVDYILKLLLGYIGILLLILAIEGITISILSFAFQVGTTMFIENTLYKLLAMVLAKVITFFIVEVWINKYKSEGVLRIKKTLTYYIIALFIFNIAIMICVIISSINYSMMEKNMAGYITLGLGIINILSLLIFEIVTKESQIYWKMKLQVQQYDMQSKYFDDINNATMKLRGLRHDVTNHLGNIQGLLIYKEYDKLEEYLNKILDDIEEVDKIIITDYPAISALLNRKYAIANKHNINCSINIENLKNLNIDDVDICIILGNLLDNAIEANMKVEKTNRNLSLDISTKNNYLIINSVNSTIQGKASLNSTKDNKEMHGIGLKNVKKIVEKYHGIIEIDAIKDYFNVSIMLYNGELID